MSIFKIEILGINPRVILFGSNIDSNDTKIIHSTQLIHQDDSIQTIKNKILKALDYKISYEELYLYGVKEKFLYKNDIFNDIVDEYDDFISPENFNSFLSNINDDIPFEVKEKYYYDDLVDLPKLLIMKTFVGIKNENLMISVDPFECKSEIKNSFIAADNSLLLNFVSDTNVLYLCLAEDVLNETQLSNEYIIQNYYPYLMNEKIIDLSNLLMKRDGLITNYKARTNEIYKYYDVIDLFYKIYDKTKYSNIEYIKNGFNNFSILLETEYKNILPLDSIFKNIHSTKKMPFIKYNPGIKRETMYRLYSEKESINGHKIPFLPTNEILRYSKELGKGEEIVILINENFQNNPINIHLFFNKNGNMIIETNFSDNIQNSIEIIEEMLTICVNPIIEEINMFLEPIGYNLRNFITFKDNHVKINKLDYVFTVKINKKIDFTKYKSLISSIFFIEDEKTLKEDSFKLYFKRIEDYRTLNENNEINGFYTDVILDKSEGTLSFNVKDITSYNYISILNVYFHSIVSLYEKASEIKDIIKDVNKTSKKEVDYEKIKETAAMIEFNTKDEKSDFFIEEEELFGLDNEKDEKIEEIEESDEPIVFGLEELEEEEEEDEEEEELTLIGGGEDDFEKDFEGERLTHPNPFQKRMEERDPNLISKKKQGKFKQYSRACLASSGRQPVILDDKEMNSINETNRDSYTEAMKHGSSEDKEHWYICPRYWDFKTNKSLTDEQVKEILEKNPKALIPFGADVIKKDQHIFEFAHPSNHFDINKNYIKHYPGLLDPGIHPDNLGMPCCFKRANKGLIEKKEKKTTNYVIDASKFPLPEDRLGFLQVQVQKMLNTDNKSCVSSTNNAIIKNKTPCFLRYGVEQTFLQSLIGCFADIYSYVQNVQKPTIEKMMQIITKAITLDKYIEYQNASFIGIFKPKIITDVNMEKYINTSFYQSLDTNDKNEMIFFKETINSYENFIKYLNDPNSIKDHHFFWSIITHPNNNLLPEGINMVIFELSKDDDSIEMLCPKNIYQRKLFDEKLGTWILLKQNEYYEPVYLYENKGSKNDYIKLFYKSDKNPSSKIFLSNIERITNRHCNAKPSMPNIYKYLQAKPLHETIEILENHNIKINYEVINYQGKITGVFVTLDEGSCYIPCFPSSPVKYDIASIEDPILWNNYRNTIDILKKINTITNGKINLLYSTNNSNPAKKIVKDGYIIGLLTSTNQFIRIIEPEEISEHIDDIEMDIGNDYIKGDINIAYEEEDKERINATKNILLESKFYSVFRTTIRILLMKTNNKINKNKIIDIIKNYDSKNYNKDLNSIYSILQDIGNDYILFDEIDIEKEEEINTCLRNCNSKNCKIKEGNCMLVIPKINLNNDLIVNKMFYYMKLSDELLRFKRIQAFVLEPNKYLNITNLKYILNDNEILLIDSFMKSEYFNELILFNDSNYIENITYDIANPNPEISQNYIGKDEIKL